MSQQGRVAKRTSAIDHRPFPVAPRFRPFNHPSRPLSQVTEDPNSGRDFPAVTDISSDAIPRHCLTKTGRDMDRVNPPSLANENRPKSGEDRLRAAQAAYDEIMMSLTKQWNVDEAEKVKSASVEAQRPRRAESDTVVSKLVSDVDSRGLGRNRILSMPKVDIPDIPMEKLRKNRKKEVAGEDRSASSARAVQTLKVAMRPVRLQHPKLSGDFSALEDAVEVNSPARRKEEDIPEDFDSASSFDEDFPSSDGDVEQNSDPRFLIDDLWNGYALKYVKGATGTPKWSKNSSRHENPTKNSFEPHRKVDIENMKPKRAGNRDQALLPQVIVKKHGKEDARNGEHSTSIPSSTNASKSSLYSQKQQSQSFSNRDRLLDVASPSSRDDLSSRTWNIRSPPTAWTKLDEIQPDYHEPAQGRGNHQAPPPYSPPTSGRARSASSSTKNRKSAELVEARKREVAAVKLRGRSLERYKAERMEKEVSDFAEMRNQFRAHPVPLWIKDHKYDQMVEEALERKRLVQARAAQLLEQTEPFHFSDIPDRHSDKRKRLYASLPVTGNNDAVPRRKRPTSVNGHGKADKEQALAYTLPRNFCSKHLPPPPTFKPVINTSVPDFARLHASQDRRLEAYRQERSWTTVTRPFTLGEIETKKSVQVANTTDGPVNGRKMSEPTPGEKMPSRRRSKSVYDSFGELVRPTRAFSLLAAYSKQKIKGENGDHLPKPSLEDQQRAERLRESLLERTSQLTGLASVLSQQKQQGPSLDQRSREYMEEMAEVKRRLSERPFIWERSQLEDRRKRIDVRFQEILQDNNVDRIFQRAMADTGTSPGH